MPLPLDTSSARSAVDLACDAVRASVSEAFAEAPARTDRLNGLAAENRVLRSNFAAVSRDIQHALDMLKSNCPDLAEKALRRALSRCRDDASRSAPVLFRLGGE